MKEVIKTFILSYPNSKIKIFLFLILTMVATILELLGIGLIFPVFSLISEKRSIVLPNFLGGHSIDPYNTLILFVFLLLSVYIIKNLYLIFFAWWQNKFLQSVYIESSLFLLKKYLSNNYSYFIKKNTSGLSQNVLIEAKNYSATVQLTLKIFLEIVIFAAIVFLLIYFQPKMTLAIIFLFSFVAIIYNKAVKNKLTFWGKERTKYNTLQLKNLSEIFNGIKTIKIYGNEKQFINEYKKNIVQFGKVATLHGTFNEIPKIWLEVLAILSISMIIIYFTLTGGEVSKIVPKLALFAGAAFRILPSINRIITSYHTISYYKSSSDILYNELNAPTHPSIYLNERKSLDFNNKIQINNLDFKYENSKNEIFKNLNLKINKHDCIGIIGASGSGKTTLIDLILGLQRSNNGEIAIDNFKLDNEEKIRLWQNNIGYVSQSTFILEDTIRKNIALSNLEDSINDKKVLSVLKSAQLSDYIEKSEHGIHSKLGEKGINLSLGEQQRFGIARALYNDPQLIVLDEPTSSLDSVTENNFLNFLSEIKLKKTMIIVSHKISNMKICNRIIKVENSEGFPSKIVEVK